MRRQVNRAAQEETTVIKEMITLGVIFALACAIGLGNWWPGSAEAAGCGFCKCAGNKLFCISRGLRTIPNLPLDQLNNLEVLALQRNFIETIDVSYLHRFISLRVLDVSQQKTGRCVKLTSPHVPVDLLIKGNNFNISLQ